MFTRPRSYFRAMLLSTVVVAGAAAAQAETLADALVSAYKNSNLLEQNRAVLRAADEDVAQAVSVLRPVIQWVASITRTETASITVPGTILTPPVLRDFDDTSSTVALRAQWLLFDFGSSRLGIQIAKELVLATRWSLVDVEQRVLLSAVQAYFGVRSAAEYVAITQNSVRVVSEFVRATQDQFDVGEVTRTDVAQAEARFESTRAQLATAEGDLAVQREAYRAATGHYPGQLAAAPPAPNLPRSLEEANGIATRSHPLILEAQHQTLAADLGIDRATASRLPSLSATGSWSKESNQPNARTYGLEMSQTLYSGGALAAQNRKAIALRDQARAGLYQSAVIVSQNVGNAWSTMEVARAQIEATDRQIEAQQIAYNGVLEEAKLGARTTLDVLDAEQELLDARAARIAAEANLQVSYYSLLATMGLLTAEWLNLGIPIYDPEAYYNAVKNAPATSIQGSSLDRVLKAIGRN